jgi:hypothetical protein
MSSKIGNDGELLRHKRSMKSIEFADRLIEEPLSKAAQITHSDRHNRMVGLYTRVERNRPGYVSGARKLYLHPQAKALP